MTTKQTCPCGSGLSYRSCCGRFIEGADAPATAEALMRSRYTAYVHGDSDYLLRTHHPRTRPPALDLEEEQNLDWHGLEIVCTDDGGESDSTGTVEFVARFETGGKPGQLRELSRFERDAGAWYYVDGDAPRSEPARAAKVGRNDPCPCGSGKKYKKCCGH